MKIFRAIEILFVAAVLFLSVNNYIKDLAIKEERQELLNNVQNDIEINIELPLKANKIDFLEQGDINISPPISKATKPKIEPEGSKNKLLKSPYECIGRIKINKINIDYPILNKTTKESLNISVTKFYGTDIHKPGNIALAGHNMKDGSLFGKLKELFQGDIIELYNKAGIMQQYKVYDIYSVEPVNLEPLNQDTDGKKIVTLITCTEQNKKRLIIKAVGIN